MAAGTIKCAICGKPTETPNALWTHIRMKAKHGDQEHQRIYSENGFDGQDSEPETPEEEEENTAGKESDKNLLEDWKENAEAQEEDAMTEVQELESPDKPADEPEFRKIAEIETSEVNDQEALEKLARVAKANPEAEIEADTDKDWMQREIRGVSA